MLDDLETSFDVPYGEAWTFDLPPTFHLAGLQVFYFKVELGPASLFIDYDEEKLQLSIVEGATSKQFLGTYELKLQLIDYHGNVSSWLHLTLNIVDLEAESQSGPSQQTSF